MISVQEIMTKAPLTLSKFNSQFDARQLMDEKRFRHIPIVDDNKKLIGLVTQRNVLANGISSQQYANLEELKEIESGILLADIMTTDITTVTPDVKIGSAAHLLHRKKYGCLPVVDNENQLVGIITDHDFVSITIQLLDMMDADEPLEIDDY